MQTTLARRQRHRRAFNRRPTGRSGTVIRGILIAIPIVILLVAARDLAQFESWPACRAVQVEHGSDGARVLTLMEMARRFRSEQEKMAALRNAGQRTMHVETMYVLDLALDRRAAPIPVKPVPWGRFERVLKDMNLE